MRTGLNGFMGIIVISMMASLAHAQKTTEQFIPLGKSPGVSGVSSYIGEIARVDKTNRTVTIIGEKGSWSVTITERTKIWLDRSKYRATNMAGTFDDLKKGRSIEAKTEVDRPQVVEWLKIIPEIIQ